MTQFSSVLLSSLIFSKMNLPRAAKKCSVYCIILNGRCFTDLVAKDFIVSLYREIKRLLFHSSSLLLHIGAAGSCSLDSTLRTRRSVVKVITNFIVRRRRRSQEPGQQSHLPPASAHLQLIITQNEP